MNAVNYLLISSIQQMEQELNSGDFQTYGKEQQSGSDSDFVVTTTSATQTEYGSFLIQALNHANFTT